MSLDTVRWELLDIADGDRILDLGCGEGRHAITASLLAKSQVVGVDLARDDLKVAHSRLSDFSSPECTFICGNGKHLPFADSTFDKVICAEVLEHIPDYEAVLEEIKRVLKPDGLFAVSVPRFFPEWVCWRLSREYHEVEGGHVRIFRSRRLRNAVEAHEMQRVSRHWSHALHVPYWWLKCLFWNTADDNPLVRTYHRMLVWDLLEAPWLTRTLDRLLNPILGKSIVMYFVNR